MVNFLPQFFTRFFTHKINEIVQPKPPSYQPYLFTAGIIGLIILIINLSIWIWD